jgi:hypothetical protein
VEVFDGKFYLRRIINEGNFERLAKRLDAPGNKYWAMRTRQGIKLSRYLLSGNKINLFMIIDGVLPCICKLHSISLHNMR